MGLFFLYYFVEQQFENEIGGSEMRNEFILTMEQEDKILAALQNERLRERILRILDCETFNPKEQELPLSFPQTPF